MELTASQEDYLETILSLIYQTGTARVRDIADRLRVAKSSVTVALRGLAKRALINYEPYQLVTLTEQGRVLGRRIRRRHKALSDFFTEILDVDKETAEANACRMEHVIGEGVMQRLSCFVEFMSNSSVPARQLPQAFRDNCDSRRKAGDCQGCNVGDKQGLESEGQGQDESMSSTTLADLKPGEQAAIVKIEGSGGIRRRLLDMGATAGTLVEIERVAPLGDPIEVKIKGYHLTLRKEEAERIKVRAV